MSDVKKRSRDWRVMGSLYCSEEIEGKRLGWARREERNLVGFCKSIFFVNIL